MKRKWFLLNKKMLALCVLILALVLMLAGTAAADGDINVSVDLTYEYQMARDVLPLVNSFRHETDVWYWNEDDTSTTVLNNLSDVILDYGMEKVAMKRAAECAIHYAHTRPNGERCFTIYPQYVGRAENIAAGYTSAQDVFDGWREENDKYSGQGHRRNMLSTGCIYIGIGCVKANGVYFWCQAFCSSPTGEAEEILVSPYIVDASLDLLTNSGMTNAEATVENVRMNEGCSVTAPSIGAYTNSGYFGIPITLINPIWTTEGTILNISGDSMAGIAGGNSTIVWTAGENRVELPVRVICATHAWSEPVTAVEATCSAVGTAVSTCSVCQETAESEIPVNPQAHQWETAVYEWAGDNMSVKATRTCSLDAGHSESAIAEATSVITIAPTYTREGEIVYTAVFSDPFTTQEKKEVLPCLPRTELNTCSVDPVNDQVYNDGNAIKPGIVIRDSDGTLLTEDKDYRISYKKNKDIGTATMTVEGLEKYTGTLTETFAIVPKTVKSPSVTAGKKQLTVKWKYDKKNDYDGYEIEYSLKQNFKSTKTVTIKKAKTTSTVIKSLKKGKTYYVRIRTWRKVSGKKYYSEWSKTLKKKVK